MYQTVPINIAGPSYTSRSLPLAAQVTRNFYQEINRAAKSPNVLQPFPGLKLFLTNAASFDAGVERGATVVDGVVYRVVSGQLYRVDNVGEHFPVGSSSDIAGEERCVFANDGSTLYIVAGSNVYESNLSTVTAVADTDIQGSTAVTSINRQFIYTKDPEFVVSDVGDGSTASALNAAQAESQPDSLVRAYTFKDDVLMFGSETTEPFYNTGTGTPPFDRITGRIASIGLGAFHSIANNDDFLYFLGDDNIVYQVTQSAYNPVSTIALTHAIESYAVVSDAIGYTLTFENQKFYVLKFPSANKTWLLNEGLGQDGWTELSSGTSAGAYQCSSCVRAYGKTLLFDGDGSYELDVNTYTNNGDTIQRVRTLSSLNGGLLGKPGGRIQMSRLQLFCHTGEGALSGQGENPRVMIEYSVDGGRSFEGGTWASVGRLGQHELKVEWHSRITFYDLIIRLTITDPVYFSIFSGSIDVRFAGW